MKKKAVILAGFPRCGTTYTWSELRKSPKIFNFTKNQENWFLQRPSVSVSEFLKTFEENISEDKIFLDVTPGYLLQVDRFIQGTEAL